MRTPIRCGKWWFWIDDVVLIDFDRPSFTEAPADSPGADIFLRGLGGWSFEISFEDARRLEQALLRRAERLPAGNDLDAEAYDRARDEANDAPGL